MTKLADRRVAEIQEAASRHEDTTRGNIRDLSLTHQFHLGSNTFQLGRKNQNHCAIG